jgi:hypothetical protein
MAAPTFPEIDHAPGHVERELAASVLVRPPRLAQSRQGTPFPESARVEAVYERDSLSPAEAREMAGLLQRAADDAEAADERLLPTLQQYCSDLHDLYEQERI